MQRSVLCRSRRELSHEYLVLSIHSQNLASIQPRTGRLKFGGMGYGPPAPHRGSTGAISSAQVGSPRIKFLISPMVHKDSSSSVRSPHYKIIDRSQTMPKPLKLFRTSRLAAWITRNASWNCFFERIGIQDYTRTKI